MSRLGITAKLDNQKHVVNVNPVNNINVSVRSPSEIQDEEIQQVQPQDVNATYNNPYTGISDIQNGVYITPTDDNVQKLTNDLLALTSQNEGLKIIIKMFKQNPIYVNHLLLVDDEQLAKLIKLMTDADDVTVDCEDLGGGCTCGPQKYRKVNAIYVNKNNKTFNLKYDFPLITKELKELGINIKVVW